LLLQKRASPRFPLPPAPLKNGVWHCSQLWNVVPLAIMRAA
jgi:hypothetical protein